jgi:hypothetical protein
MEPSSMGCIRRALLLGPRQALILGLCDLVVGTSVVARALLEGWLGRSSWLPYSVEGILVACVVAHAMIAWALFRRRSVLMGGIVLSRLVACVALVLFLRVSTEGVLDGYRLLRASAIVFVYFAFSSAQHLLVLRPLWGLLGERTPLLIDGIMVVWTLSVFGMFLCYPFGFFAGVPLGVYSIIVASMSWRLLALWGPWPHGSDGMR